MPTAVPPHPQPSHHQAPGFSGKYVLATLFALIILSITCLVSWAAHTPGVPDARARLKVPVQGL